MSYTSSKRQRPFRNSGVAYKPKRNKPELAIQLRFIANVKKYYPHVIIHSDFAAGLDLTENQAKINKRLQSEHKFPDVVIFTPSRGYVGFILEIKDDNTPVILKAGPDKGKLTTNPHIRAQAETLRQLNKQGWWANFGVGYEQCWAMWCWYIKHEQGELF